MMKVALAVVALSGCITNDNRLVSPEPGSATFWTVDASCEAQDRLIHADFVLDVTLDEGQALDVDGRWGNPEVVSGRQEYDCGEWTTIDPADAPPGGLWDGCVREAGQPARQTVIVRKDSRVSGDTVPAFFYASVAAYVFASPDGGLAAVGTHRDIACQ